MAMMETDGEFETEPEDDLLFALQDTAKPGSPWPWLTILVVAVAIWWLSRR